MLTAQDLNNVAGVQSTGIVGFLAGGTADSQLVDDGGHVLIDYQRLALGGLGLGLTRFRVIIKADVDTGFGSILGFIAVLLHAAGEHAEHQGHSEEKAQEFSERICIGEIHGVTSLSSHFSSLL